MGNMKVTGWPNEFSHMLFLLIHLFLTTVVEFQFAKSWLRSHLSSDLLDMRGELANYLLHPETRVIPRYSACVLQKR